MQRVGVISDTHGLLRPEALAFLVGCDHIVHAGDVCDAGVLGRLREIAPVTAVRGNNDRGGWARALPVFGVLQVDGVCIGVIHDLAELDVDPRAAGLHVVVSGHSHKPLRETRDGVVYLNPGSAGPRRFRLPVAIGELVVDGTAFDARVIELA
ncbi:MAG TPA: metallophosphoesterase family protein [Xanthomonadales bacterium]|nr:metallophosphoesterase family protein [Xanthomonadales bacterium]